MTLYAGKRGALYIWNGAVTAYSSEACTVVGNTAQITNTVKRLLSPNHSQAFSPQNSVHLLSLDYLTATATFDGAPGTTTATGSYIAAAAISQALQIYDWKLDVAGDLYDTTCFGQDWKTNQAGLMNWKGTIDGYWYDPTWFNALNAIQVGGTNIYWWLLKLYLNYAGTLYFMGFANVNGISDSAAVTELVKEAITFTGNGPIEYFTS
jgi:hypothetical protein